jgi:tetratricopeptide (TPR) repeat protein
VKFLFFSLLIISYQIGLSQKKELPVSLLEQLSNNEDSARANILLKLATYYLDSEKFDSAKLYAEEAIAVSQKNNLLSTYCKASRGLGRVYRFYGNQIKALQALLPALKVAKSNNLSEEAAGLLNTIGLSYIDLKDYPKAMEYQLECKLLAQRINDTILLMHTYEILAIVSESMQDYKTAKENLYAELKLMNLIQYKQLPELLKDKIVLKSNIASVFNDLKEYDSAMIILRPLYHQVKIMELLIAQRFVSIDMATTFNGLKQYDSTLIYLDRALLLMKTDSIPDIYRRIYEQQVVAYRGKKEFDKALQSQINLQSINDSLFNSEKRNAITRIQTEYETKAKDQQIASLNQGKKRQKIINGLAISAALLTLGGLLLAIRSRKLQSKLFKQQQLLAQNESQKKMINSELKALRAQMNPHFIFNVINSIQHYIIRFDVKKANEYLHKFSVLIRQNLQSSTQFTISLQEEIKSLKLYLELELLRLEEKMAYSINADESLLQQGIHIPSMIIQPYIENSIKHGISPLTDRKGQLTIDFTLTDGFLVCTIEDNGIGIKNSLAIKKENDQMLHRSMGTNITSERIRTINELNDKKIILNVFEKNEKNSNGTIVEISFPI